jgi:hypothetical protein
MGQATIIKMADGKVAARLLRFLGEDEAWHFNLKLERGTDWLQHHYGAGVMCDRLAASPLFWAWWNNAWAGRDASLSSKLRVLDTAVMVYTLNGAPAGFFHGPEDFGPFYLAHHDVTRLEIQMDPQILNTVLRRAKAA